MSWKEYYENVSVEPMLAHKIQIQKALARIKLVNSEVPILPQNGPITLMLAGYHPGATNETDLLELLNCIHKHPEDRLVMVDQNHTSPTKHLRSISIQADLTHHIPNLDGLVDISIMHYTLDFIPDSAIANVGLSASHYLSPNGLLVSVNDYSPFTFISSIIGSIVNRVPNYVRPTADIVYELSPYLKLIFWGSGRFSNFHVFARADSPLCEYPLSEDSICLDFDD